MNDKELVLSTMRAYGKQMALNLQANASEMTGTEIIANEEFLPKFDPKRQYLNYVAGYVCISPSENAVRLLQPYDSTIYTDDPEFLISQWGFYWSTDPKKAKQFMALSTSPYMKDDCCIYMGNVYRSGQDNNVWKPGTTGVKWEDLGPVEDWQ